MATGGVAYNAGMQGMTHRHLAAGPRSGRDGLQRRLAPALLAMLGLLALPVLQCRADSGDGSEPARVATTVVTPSVGSNSLSGGGTHAVSGLTIPIVSMPQADEVIVHKGERRLYLMRNGQVLRSYRIALGLDPQGPKEREGDFRTPEGHYLLTRRNPRSDYFLSIQVSYPNAEDLRRAQREHIDPGGSIMLHGLPNALSHKPSYYAKADWTDGCIALSDSDMVEVWLMTRDNTPIEILP
jgi:hypothetical protein